MHRSAIVNCQRVAFTLAIGFVGTFSSTAFGQAKDDIRELKLRDWEPRPMLVTKTTVVETPAFPAIDVHNHLGGGKEFLTTERVARYLAEMDAAGVRTVVNLDGGWGERLKGTLDALDNAHPGRFLTFALVNFDGIDDPDWSRREAGRLEESFRLGAKGLKFHKSLGLRIRYRNGKLMTVDDRKLDPIWETCARHSRPVMIHTADPAAFFTPLDRFNERWHELNQHPEWLFHGPTLPSRQELLDQLERVVARHPKTTFIGAHFGNNAEDLISVGRWLDQYPNFHIDIDARISELGRQPYTARRFFIKYQDRIMFGTDTTPRRNAFQIYYRFLETDDEYFDCAASHHRQGFWMIYGISLPRDVLAKVYHRNAERLLFGLNALQPTSALPTMRVVSTADFEITGDGGNTAWKKTRWTTLKRRVQNGQPYDTRVKMLYSGTGLYVLMEGTDEQVTASFADDFLDLWTQDVFEVFVWPDERYPVYFEYEISPLGYELPILVPNLEEKFFGWRPWHYEGGRRIKKATATVGGPKKPNATITGWTAELFIPYDLLRPLPNVPPKPGARWRANFYRMDYDAGKTTSWDWARVGPSFHEFHKFGTLVFE
jgi:predicted TIM-barrel fold metal-dependent hydrolase